MKHQSVVFLLLVAMLALAGSATAATGIVSGYIYSDGTSLVLPLPTPTNVTPIVPKNVTATVPKKTVDRVLHQNGSLVPRKYPIPSWTPKQFDGTQATCRMGVIGTTTMGKLVCYRPRRHRS
jgi:hypothetical protein